MPVFLAITAGQKPSGFHISIISLKTLEQHAWLETDHEPDATTADHLNHATATLNRHGWRLAGNSNLAFFTGYKARGWADVPGIGWCAHIEPTPAPAPTCRYEPTEVTGMTHTADLDALR